MTLQSLDRTPELDNPGPHLIDDRLTARLRFGSTRLMHDLPYRTGDRCESGGDLTGSDIRSMTPPDGEFPLISLF
jgi:hypothetical protein